MKDLEDDDRETVVVVGGACDGLRACTAVVAADNRSHLLWFGAFPETTLIWR